MRKVAHFYGFEEMGRHMRADANASALARLPAAAEAEITARCAPGARAFRLSRRPPAGKSGINRGRARPLRPAASLSMVKPVPLPYKYRSRDLRGAVRHTGIVEGVRARLPLRPASLRIA